MNTMQLWDSWAPLAARILLAIQFGVGAFFKVTLFSMQVGATAAAGVPMATLAVSLALILEIAGIVALLTGYYIRLLSALLAGYVMLLAVIFYHNWSDQMSFGSFMSHLGMTAALLLLSVYGGKRFMQSTGSTM